MELESLEQLQTQKRSVNGELERLRNITASEEFAKIPKAHQCLLKAQRNAMRTLNGILKGRIRITMLGERLRNA